MATASTVNWPTEFRPGTTDHFVSNETVARGLTATQVWPYLADVSQWTAYYSGVSRVQPPASGCPLLQPGDTFSFSMLGHALLPAEVHESVPPGTPAGGGGAPGRLGWRVGKAGDAVESYVAWVVEDLPWGGAVRILLQETLVGAQAARLAAVRPDPFLWAHQDWLDSLVRFSRDKTK